MKKSTNKKTYISCARDAAEVLKKHADKLQSIAKFLSTSPAATEFSSSVMDLLKSTIDDSPVVDRACKKMYIVSVQRGKTLFREFDKDITNGNLKSNWRNIIAAACED